MADKRKEKRLQELTWGREREAKTLKDEYENNKHVSEKNKEVINQLKEAAMFDYRGLDIKSAGMTVITPYYAYEALFEWREYQLEQISKERLRIKVSMERQVSQLVEQCERIEKRNPEILVRLKELGVVPVSE